MVDSWGSRVLNRGFRRYVRRFVKSSFNAVRVAGAEHARGLPSGPLVVYVNHPGWWDPMAAVLLTDLLLQRKFAAPMDAAALVRYPVLERLGFFAVERDSAAGARDFLRQSRRVLAAGDVALWITPTGRFHDVRESVPFQSGLSHLLDREFGGSVLPAALEYVFWNERRPELLARFGPAMSGLAFPEDRGERTLYLEQRLAEQQSALAGQALERSGVGFEQLLAGAGGIGGLYDAWRRMSCWLRGSVFESRHEAAGGGRR
ncbi:MAG: lysophospholipid acyltransferase family protein [Planctomycetota bacterium]